jgi:hypothetical protein
MAKKQTIRYDSQLDALVAVAKQLSIYEERHKITSEDFYHRFSEGKMGDTVEFIEWSNAYLHFIALRDRVEKQINNAA